MYTYICTDGHVVDAPTMGTYDSCPALEPVIMQGEVRGRAPCGCAVVKVPMNETIEAAYRIGGKQAVTKALRDAMTGGRLRDGLIHTTGAHAAVG